MKTTSLLSIAAAASLTAFLSSLLLTQDLVIATAALAVAMAILTLVHEYTPRTHFVVTPADRRLRRSASVTVNFPAQARMVRRHANELTLAN